MPTDRSVLTACLHDLFQGQLHAVLATADGGVPHASLVAFAASPDLRRLVFTTARATKKFRNLAASGTVALLIDNRTNTASDVAEAAAVTVVGRAGEATGAEREQLLALLLARHPGLADFARAVDTAVVAVRVERYLLVDRFQRVRVLAADDLD